MSKVTSLQHQLTAPLVGLTSAEFRARLADLGLSQSALARKLIELGDHRSFSNVLHSISRMATGDHVVSGEITVILELLHRAA